MTATAKRLQPVPDPNAKRITPVPASPKPCPKKSGIVDAIARKLAEREPRR